MKKSILFLVILFCAFKCKKPFDKDYPVDIQNNTDHSITFHVAGLGAEHVYPDTALESTKPPMEVIPSGQTRTWSVRYSFEEYFDRLPADKFSIYLFHLDTLNSNSWNQIISGYKILRRYDLSLSDLKNNNYRIAYP